MATVYYTAASLDGFIVDENKSLDWLVSRDIDADGPFAIDPFLASVGALVMGADTYEWILDNQPGEWMYPQPSWVLTHRDGLVADGHDVQTFAGDVADLHPVLCAAAGDKLVHVMGGADVIRQALSAGYVEELSISIAPVVLGGGKRLFDSFTETLNLEHMRTLQSPFATHITYRVVR